MSEIRNYRGKLVGTGVWVYGDLINLTDKHKGIVQSFDICRTCNGEAFDFSYVEVDPDTVGQLTGLRDVNNQDIYEGDLGYIEIGDDTGIFEVIFKDGAFCVKIPLDPIYRLFRNTAGFDIIGNIHDNPELLEGK